MDGVTILNEFTVLADFFFLVPLAVAIFGLFVFIVGTIEDDSVGFGGAMLLVFFIPLTIGGIISGQVTRYEALVDPTVPAAALMEKYEVIERKGEIWVLEPLEEETDEQV